ncbi:MAG: MBL fold metallo-hydrolase [Pseudomonadota bacterium]
MKLRFWGVRGSIPVPGARALRYGGNSSCVEITAPGAPSFVLDCGTGARELGVELLGRPTRQLIVAFTHFHIDHTLGFPFFAPIYAPSFDVEILLPGHDPAEARGLLMEFLNGVFHPLRLADIPAPVRYTSMVPGVPRMVGSYLVRTVALNHPGGACGYRVEHGGRAIGYFTDTSPMARPDEGVLVGQAPTEAEERVIAAMVGLDALVFDTMFTREAYLERMGWGHSYPEYAVALARAAGVPQLYLFHHAPEASDDDLDALAARWAGSRGPVVHVAREGGEVDLEG